MKTRMTHGARRAFARSVLAAGILLLLGAARARGDFGLDEPVTDGPMPHNLGANGARFVATDGHQNIHVLYAGFEFHHGYDQEVAPYYRKFDQAAGTWLPPERIAPEAPGDRTVCWWNLAMAVDCEGNAHVIWLNMVAGPTGGLHYRMRHAGGSWTPDEPVGTPPVGGESPSIAVDPNGNVFASYVVGLWNTDSNFLYNCFCVVRDASFGMWGPSTALTSHVVGTAPSPGATHPAVALTTRAEADTTVAVYVWSDSPAGHVACRSLIRDVGGAEYLGSTQFLPDTQGSPSIAIRCDLVHVAWAAFADGSSSILHSVGVVVKADSIWFAPTEDTGIWDAGPPSLAIDGLDNAHMIYTQGGYVDHARWDRLDQSWTISGHVSDYASSDSPSLAVDDVGDLHAVWGDSRDPMATHIYYDRGSCMVSATVPPIPFSQIVQIPENLRSIQDAATGGDRIPVVMMLREQADRKSLAARVTGLTPAERRQLVIPELRQLAQETQRSLLSTLETSERLGEAEQVRPLWMINAIVARVSPRLLDQLARWGDLASIHYDPTVPLIDNAGPEGRAVEKTSPLGGTAGTPSKASPGSPDAIPTSAPADTAWGVKAIGAPAVWAMGYRGQCVLVAVLDTGVSLTHPDLTHALWVSWAEIPGNGIDDDSNGVIDDRLGYDFVNQDRFPDDDNGHGTHVAGIIAGDGTGGTLTGVAPESRILPVKVLDDTGAGSYGNMMQGIEYAVDSGAQVLNLSLGANCYAPSYRDSMRVFAEIVSILGVTMCAAAGNENCQISPPNAIDSPGDVPPPWIPDDMRLLGSPGGVTTVGAVDQTDQWAGSSSRGPVDWSQVPGYGDWKLCDSRMPHTGLIKPDLSAPGVDILSTDWQSPGYVTGQGTSAATPHVAGLVALMLSRNPMLNPLDIDYYLERTALDLDAPGKDNRTGSGRIQALDALGSVPPLVQDPIKITGHQHSDPPPDGNGDGQMQPDETHALTVTLENISPHLLGSVEAVLGADSTISMIDGYALYGNIPSGASRTNDAHPFRFTVKPDAPPGHVVLFTVSISSYGVCETVAFQDTIQIKLACVDTHDASGVLCSLTNEGIVGFLAGDHQHGSGFVYPKQSGINRLFIGSLWAGTDSTYALNRDYDADPVKDWSPGECLTLVGKQDGRDVSADEVGIASFTDAGHPAPRGLEIIQQSYTWSAPPDDKYVIVTYDAVNHGSSSLPDIWLGLFMDWDLDETSGYGENRGHVDPTRALVYMWHPSGGDGSYVGIRSLSHPYPQQMSLVYNPSWVWPYAYITDADRYHLLTGDDPAYVVTDTPEANDWGMVIGVAPFTIAAGDTAEVAFALVAGSSLADLNVNADAAAQRWADNWGDASSVPDPAAGLIPARLDFAPPSPNPVTASTLLRFALPRAAVASLDLFDAAGRRLDGIAEEFFATGWHNVLWDGRDRTGRRYSGGIYYLRLRTGRESRSQKVVLTR